MIDREFNTITLNSGKQMLTVAFPDKEYVLLSTFFFVEVEAFEDFDELLEAIRKALQ